jgi:hypothetical protein
MTPYIEEILARSNDAAKFVKGQTNALLTPFVFNLGSAGSQELDIQGNFLYAVSASDATANVDVQLNRQANEIAKLNITKNLGYQHPFMKVFVSWTAQPGKTLTMLFGQQAGELISVIDNRSAVDINALLGDIKTNTGNTVTDLLALIQAVKGINPETGAQIIKNASANNATVVVHTVTAGKTFYLTSMLHSTSLPTGVVGSNVFVTNAADVQQYVLSELLSPGTPAVAANSPISYLPALKIPAGFKIKLFASTSTVYSKCCITGWEA